MTSSKRLTRPIVIFPSPAHELPSHPINFRPHFSFFGVLCPINRHNDAGTLYIRLAPWSTLTQPLSCKMMTIIPRNDDTRVDPL
ncbi:hypothetical protein PENANT_c005G06437 [Penicillium antarcticum]|uniref:Uncharacterized protein n=1 Tax=Penicillium antarcticum TaxID=416450 RepID=A0A1V6QG36_9EURO|nr:hypothetical protein PENANT_c005G06437 [Penicillium antarcticum]